MSETAQVELPRWKCHKVVHAIKIMSVVKHALPRNTTPDEDVIFEASPAFQGAHLFPDDKAYGPIPVDAAYYRKHNPSAGGYYVVYDDGYLSFSPARAFEEGYTRISRGGSDRAPQVGSLLRFFECSHLPVHLQIIVQPFAELAQTIASGPVNAETTVALRKLLEAKDCAVRAAL